METGKEILKNCKVYFLESSPNSMDSVILLEDAIEAIDNANKVNKERIHKTLLDIKLNLLKL